MTRLAHGVVAGRGRKVWAPGPRGLPVDAADAVLEPGAAVAVGAAGADEAEVRRALVELARFVAAAGLPAAGAGVDLGGGFRSARLDGGGGDRRDAVLAALRVLGVKGSARLGDRAGLVVALFGPDVTKPVGTAAARAIRDGRWAALQLASAASDLLGPEQLERVLDLDADESTTDGTASVLADHLAQVLGPVSRPRRLTLLLDLWREVGAQREATARLDRLRAARGRQDRYHELRRRYVDGVEREIVLQLTGQFGHEPTVGEAARWVPPAWQVSSWLHWVLHDALAATVLLRVAAAVAVHGPAEGLARSRQMIGTATFLLNDEAYARANRRVPGLMAVPARPGCYVRQLHERLGTDTPGGDSPIDESTVAFARQRLARAYDYGRVVLDAARELVSAGQRFDYYSTWHCLSRWRPIAGYGRAPEVWEQPPLGGGRVLAERLRDTPGTAAAELEQPHDLLWYADLADALARLNGHEAAEVVCGENVPYVNADPPAPEAEPLRPQPDSIALAVAGAAQLVSLGAEVPRRARTWAELVEALLADARIAEALTGTFDVAAPITGRDGTVVPGTDLRVEVAREPTKLAEWARYMGNCIAGYANAARDGECVLVALRAPNGRIVANLELLPHRSGWTIGQFLGRFNAYPADDLAGAVRAWVAAIRPARPRPAPVPGRPHPRGVQHRHRRVQLMREVGAPLAEAAAAELADPEVAAALAVMAADPAGVTALRRAQDPRVEEILTRRLEAETLVRLWTATGVRPLARAVSRLDPEVRERHGHLRLLLAGGPLPSAPARLARLPEVAEARTVDLVGRRLRAAIGRLARRDDQALAAALARAVDTGLLCALVLAVSGAADGDRPYGIDLTPVTSPGSAAVPGFPRSRLDDPDGPWQRARPDAEELGADPERRRDDAILVVPTAWLGPGGWRALWARAAR